MSRKRVRMCPCAACGKQGVLEFCTEKLDFCSEACRDAYMAQDYFRGRSDDHVDQPAQSYHRIEPDDHDATLDETLADMGFYDEDRFDVNRNCGS